ncbi:adenylate/guanylate cyclase domain-containing protein [Leptospira sp. SA-E8]|uniref:adenylate/guanylate cyclase domain-containing protein n=1 Tax=Leptospira sp. SA-E8 TaxID=3422259 RepID=UPI003EBC315A
MKPLNFLISKKIQPKDEKFYRTTQRAYIFGALSHGSSIFIFWRLNMPEMMWFNMVISIPSFVAAMIINRKGYVNVAFSIAFFELYFHQVAGIYFAGWSFGFQYWLIYLVGLGFFNPTWKRGIQFFQLGLFTLTVFIMYTFFREGIYKLPNDVISIAHIVNTISAILVLAILITGYSKAAHDAEETLFLAHQEARRLLLNILPESVAIRLNAGEKNIADSMDQVTILFCDLVGFTQLSTRKTAEELVVILNGIFYGFDSIVEELGLEKIKTIGDGYMVGSGVPQARADHALAAANCAIGMQQFLKEFNEKMALDLKLRIGISSGPIVAGVIGKNKFSYDLWGDTVNTASRMESTGEPGKIHLSSFTQILIKDYCELTHRGEIDVKGKGLMNTYFLRSIYREYLYSEVGRSRELINGD